MSEERKKLLDTAAASLDGLTDEQADYVLSRACDFMSGVSSAVRRYEAQKPTETNTQ